jgi:hypothetical protein
MTKCPPKPDLIYQREPCSICGAITEKEAETKCKPQSDETGERYCGSEFLNGFAVAATAESLAAESDWYDRHYACFDECVLLAR